MTLAGPAVPLVSIVTPGGKRKCRPPEDVTAHEAVQLALFLHWAGRTHRSSNDVQAMLVELGIERLFDREEPR